MSPISSDTRASRFFIPMMCYRRPSDGHPRADDCDEQPDFACGSPLGASKLTSCSAQKSLWRLRRFRRQQFLEPVTRCVVDRVALGNTLKFNGVHDGEEDQCNAVARASRPARISIEGISAGNGKGDRRPLPWYQKPANHIDSGSMTAAPQKTTTFRRVRIRSQSVEEAESRPCCGLVLCIPPYEWLPSYGDRRPFLRRKGPGNNPLGCF